MAPMEPLEWVSAMEPTAVGCCWLLMTLSFVLGAMNLLWIAVLTALVLVEKVAPKGDWVSRITGTGFAVWGIMLLFPI